ncbi:MAG: DUF2513 domain-containing protein [Acidobacteriota bacterium]|nr:DUF2513 domain-containing protein [Acidobacteriota bacterium]
MKRDMELIRKILINVQNGDLNEGVKGYDDDTVKYNKALLKDRGLVEAMVHYSSIGDKPEDIPDLVIIKKLTWEGHDFIEAIENEGKWKKVKAFLSDAGKDVTIETIKYAVKQLFGFADS